MHYQLLNLLLIINSHESILHTIKTKTKTLYNEKRDNALNELQEIKDIKLNCKRAEFLATLHTSTNNPRVISVKPQYKKEWIDLIKKSQINHPDPTNKEFVIYNNL